MPISIKLVRGAYYADEIKHAEEHGLENPIHDTLEKTHSCYDACASKIISDLKPNDKVSYIYLTLRSLLQPTMRIAL